MRFFATILSSIFILFFTISIGATQMSCTKTITNHDTTIKTIHDTTVIRDTTIIHDTIECNKGLVAYYNFNNGTLNDSSGFGNNITFNNAVKTTDRFGNANNAYLFNGSSSYMTVTNSQSLSTFSSITMYAVVKINGFFQGSCALNQIFSKGYPYDISGFYGLQFGDPTNQNCGTPNVNTETMGGIFGDNYPQGSAANSYTDTSFIVLGRWYSVAYTYDGISAKLYINGQLKDSRTKTTTYTPNNFNLMIGKHENPYYPYYLNGVIDEIRIYNKALNQSAITQLTNLTN